MTWSVEPNGVTAELAHTSVSTRVLIDDTLGAELTQCVAAATVVCSRRRRRLGRRLSTSLVVRTRRRHYLPVCTDTFTPSFTTNTSSNEIDDRPTALPRPRALDSAAAAGIGRATPHASPRYRAADDATVRAYTTAAVTNPVTLTFNPRRATVMARARIQTLKFKG